MRIIDIFYEDKNSDTGFRLVSTDYIQTGEAAFSRSSNGKTFTMADGSLLMYPVRHDKIQMTLQLECTRNKAVSLENAMYRGKLLFAGISTGTVQTATPTDKNYLNKPKHALAGYLTRDFRSKQISADLFALEIGMQLEDTQYLIPVILTGFGSQEGLKIQDTVQNFSDFVYQKDGVFHRKQVIFTSDSRISIAFPVIISIDAGTISAYLKRDSKILKSWSQMTQGAYCETVQELQSGMNLFQIGISAPYTCKPFFLQFRVYKFP